MAYGEIKRLAVLAAVVALAGCADGEPRDGGGGGYYRQDGRTHGTEGEKPMVDPNFGAPLGVEGSPAGERTR